MTDEERDGERQQTDAPADGPGSGGSSQDEPGHRQDRVVSDETVISHPDGSGTHDTNESADDKIEVLDPDGSETTRG